MSMDKELQRKLILEAQGWSDLSRSGRQGDDGPLGALRGTSPDGKKGQIAPNPLTNLNAMHEAEKVMTDDVIVYTHNGREWGTTQRGMYFQMLSFGNDMKGNHVMKSDGIHATAAQRAEAFLRTLNLWQPPTGEENE